MLSGNLFTTSLSNTAKSWLARMTVSRITLCFFFLALANSIAQTTIQVLALSASSAGRELVTDTIDVAGVQRGFVVVDGSTVEICSGIPNTSGTICNTVYNGTAHSDQAAVAELQAIDALLAKRTSSVSPVTIDGDVLGVNVTGIDSSSSTTFLSMQCVESLTWLESFLRDDDSEDIVHLVFQVWLFVMSLIALVAESIPHLIVVLGSHAVNTAWAGFRLYTDIQAKRIYEQVIVDDACAGTSILGTWNRDLVRYVLMGVNGGVLLCMMFLVYKLVKMYSKETVGSIGSSALVNRVLKLTLWMNVCIQFASFFAVTFAAIWYNKRKTDIIESYAKDTLCDVAFYVVAVVSLPWLWLGTYSVRRENRALFLVFTLISLVLLVVSGLWFGDALFLYELSDWPFLAAVTILADSFLLATCVLALTCRVHFGLGLAHFLLVQKELQDSGFTQDTFAHDPITTREHTTSSPSDFMPSKESSARLSACSVQSGVFETWISASRKFGVDVNVGDEEKGRRVAPIPLVLSTVSSRSSVVSSLDGDEKDEKKLALV
ncbi:hypothetical protein F5I97DRAFT_1989830 [Phlebopus sp. FC_14]|nr:hypothetical protein F5I97DRAFT_1989830 [Phlebopus sp. FC_14]